MPSPIPTPKDGLGRERARSATVRPLGTGPSVSEDGRRSAAPTIASYLTVIWQDRRTVFTVLGAVLALAAVYLILATPTFHAEALVRVEARRPAIAGLEELSSVFGEDPGEAEIEIVRSRMLLGSVVDQLNLTVSAAPRPFPVIGAAAARRHVGDAPASPPLPVATEYAWGGELIDVERLIASDDLIGKPLTLTALEDKRYRVTTKDGDVLVEGLVGAAAKAGQEGARRHVELVVSQLVARPGTEFVLKKRARENVIDGLQTKLRVQQKGRRTGMLVISLEGEDPTQLAAIVNAIANTYLRQNVERKSAEAAKTLEFIESQLPRLKENLDKAEKNLNTFRVNTGTVDSKTETTAMLERERELERQISELEMRRSELRKSFTESHPNLVAVANQLAQLKNERAGLSGRMKSLPQAEVDSARLQREVTDATDLYVGLLNRAQELRVVKSGTIGDVRIIDRAHVPNRPASPLPLAVLVLSTMLGLTLGAVAAVVRSSLAKHAETPEEIEAATNLPVFVTIPRSLAQADASRRRGGPLLLAATDPQGGAIETFRSLRTSLQFALVEAENSVVAVAGPAPGVGKSFVAMNLAEVLAAAGKKVLLVDCDLRRGRIHRQFGLERRPGLSDVVSGATPLEQAIRATDEKDLFLLSTGQIPPNPAELLSTARFEALLREVSQRFDLVVIDTPPVLAVSDAMLVARLAGVNLLVLRAGMHNAREIGLAVKQFDLNGVRLNGCVLNDMRAPRGGHYGGSGYLRYDYQSDHPETP